MLLQDFFFQGLMLLTFLLQGSQALGAESQNTGTLQMIQAKADAKGLAFGVEIQME